MAFKNLQEYIEFLDDRGELVHVTAEVDVELEISEITDRVSKKNGPALLFENVKGYDFPVLTNAYGSYKRMEYVLNCNRLEEISEKINDIIKFQPPGGIIDKLKLIGKLREFSVIFPKKVKKAPCQDKIITGGKLLDLLPILKTWPRDGGPFVTLPLVVTKDPETGSQNLGMYRMQKFTNDTTGMHWQYNKDGARHFEKYKKLKKRMDVAVALGGVPSVTYAATAPLPPDIDELMFAGWLEGRSIELVRGKTVDLYVPAQSDFVIEGYVDIDEIKTEGPFGDHTGFYSPADNYPVFHVTAVTHRKDAVYPATVVGKPPMEDCYMAKATERIFLPLIKMLVPEIVDINLPVEGVFHNCALISIDKKYPGQAKKVISAIWGMMQMAPTKFIAVFDSDIDLNDYSTVAWKFFNNVDPKRDFLISEGPLDALDHSASYANFGGKLGIDATRKTREEGMGRDWPDEIKMSEDIINLVNDKWKDYGIDL